MSDLEDGQFYVGTGCISDDSVAASIKIVDQDEGVIVSAEIVITDPKVGELSGEELLYRSIDKPKSFFS